MTRAALRRKIHRRVAQRGLSLRGFVATLGLPDYWSATLCQFLKHDHVRPSPVLLRALGYQRVDSEQYEVIR